MSETYGIHSKFDIEMHKKTFINYMEAVILPSGEVQYATPSHLEKLIYISGLHRDVIYDLMPVTASPVHWLTAFTGCICVWSEFHIGAPTTEKQESSLQLLITENLTR